MLRLTFFKKKYFAFFTFINIFFCANHCNVIGQHSTAKRFNIYDCFTFLTFCLMNYCFLLCSLDVKSLDNVKVFFSVCHLLKMKICSFKRKIRVILYRAWLGTQSKVKYIVWCVIISVLKEVSSSLVNYLNTSFFEAKGC